MSELRIRAMRPKEIAIAADWAAAEGWNPGLADAACFATVDPQGFFIGELDGEPAATVSCVNYDARFAFLGFYIVREDLRGRGYGLRVWNAAIARAGAWGSKLIIMDEPTAALGVAETRAVEDVIFSLRERGLAVLVISHNLDQVFRITDRIWVLRRGSNIGSRDTAKTHPDEIVSMITGAAGARHD